MSDNAVRHSLAYRAEMVRGGRRPLCENLAETDQPPSKTPISNYYSFIVHQP